MKNLFLLLVALAVCSSFSFAQEAIEATQVGAQVDPNQPIIEFEKKVHDFGTIEYKGDGSCEFFFKNTGKDPLIITNAKASCGCTVPSWPKEPIASGASGTITVKYDTKRQGNFQKTITIFSNATVPQERLTIKGNVKPDPNPPATDPAKNQAVQTTPVNKPVGPVNETELK